MNGALTLGTFREQTRDLPDDTPLTVCLVTEEDMRQVLLSARRKAKRPGDEVQVRLAYRVPLMVIGDAEGRLILLTMAGPEEF
jgi:hypothetical protein